MAKGQKITTFLMFSGQAEEAMKFYTSLFDQSEVGNVVHHEDGTLQATFTLNGQTFMCIDSAVKHAFSFTPAISLYVDCASVEEITRLFTELSNDGLVLMPLGAYPFAEKFAWVQDRFGVSWQLSLPKAVN